MHDANKSVKEIVLTGGPSAGKSSALAHIVEELATLGTRVLTVPEAATMLITGGVGDFIYLAEHDRSRYLELQQELLALQSNLRERYLSLANCFPESVVIIYDRGQMDSAAYTDEKEFQTLMRQAGASYRDWRDSYDAVLHLVSAANGAEDFYTTANNSARQESLQEARQADQRTLQAWVGHPHLRVIDNSSDFKNKLKQVTKEVLHVLGIPEPLEIEKKYLLQSAPKPDHQLLEKAVKVEIEQHYLLSEESELRVRRRSQDGDSTYFRTEKRELKPGVRIELEKIISPEDYRKALLLRDPNFAAIKKQRYCFVYQTTYCELDIYQAEHSGLAVLEIELSEENAHFSLPGFEIANEVTHDKSYSNRELARLALND